MSRLPRLTLFFIVFCCPVLADRPLPSCSEIPRVLCCIDRIATNCPKGCRAYIEEKCPYKLEKLFGSKTIATTTPSSSSTSTASAWERLERRENAPISSTRPPRRSFVDNEPMSQPQPTPSLPRSSPRPVKSNPPSRPHIHNTFEPVPAQVFDDKGPEHLSPAQFVGSDIRSISNVRNIIDSEHQPHCGTDHATPPFAPCVDRQIADERFLSCCKGQIPSSCHSLCSYEHREKVAARNFINAVQHEGCDLKWISTILHCANKAKDNRQCCETLNLANPELGVGDRCLRMCYVPSDRETIGHVHQQDLVCLSNWNVIMYCARSGLRNY